MGETEENYECHHETNEAKLRNQMSPMYGLPEMVMMWNDEEDPEKKEKILKFVISTGRKAEESMPRVHELLQTIEKDNIKLNIESQITVLEGHVEHPTKPGYKRHDILDKIKELKFQLK